jgi:hypothetical protein
MQAGCQTTGMGLGCCLSAARAINELLPSKLNRKSVLATYVQLPPQHEQYSTVQVALQLQRACSLHMALHYAKWMQRLCSRML